MSNSNSFESDFDSDKESDNNQDFFKFPITKKPENSANYENLKKPSISEKVQESEKISDSENEKENLQNGKYFI